jgi:anti-anti-sigma factor
MASISASIIQRRMNSAPKAARIRNKTLGLICPMLPSSYHAFRSVARRDTIPSQVRLAPRGKTVIPCQSGVSQPDKSAAPEAITANFPVPARGFGDVNNVKYVDFRGRMGPFYPFYRAIPSPSYSLCAVRRVQISNMTTVHNANQMQPSRFAAFHAAGAHSLIDNARMKFTVEFMRTAGKVVLQLAGQLDETTIPQLEREIAYWQNRGEKTLVLDLKSVELIRKEGVRSILMMGMLLEQAGGNLVLCGLYGSVGRVFRMYGVDGAFETFESIEELENQTLNRVIQ